MTGQITKHFSWSEAACHDGTEVPAVLRPNVQHLCAELEVLRVDLDTAIHVDDMYRTPAHNAAVGGAAHSQHLLGKAADIRVPGMTAAALHARIEALIKAGKMHNGGLGLYSGFVHYDVRDTPTRWQG